MSPLGANDGRRTFRALRTRNFRHYFVGHLLSQTGEWAQRIGQVVLILRLTDSGTVLGITAALQFAPMMLGPWGGLVADRADRRKILMATQVAFSLLALLLAALVDSGSATVALVMVLAFLSGVAKLFDDPARQSFVLDMVGRNDLVNAVALNVIVFNAARVVGPAVGGFLIEGIGLSASFYLNAVLYLPLLLVLATVDRSQLRPVGRQPRSSGQLRLGLRHIKQTPRLFGALLSLTVAGVVIYVHQVTIPLLARDAVSGDAGTIGLFFTSMGVGAVLGGVFIARFVEPAERSFTTAGLLLGAACVVVAALPTRVTLVAGLVLLGAAGSAFRVLGTSVVQLWASEEMRGRVMGVLTVALFGTTPIGGPLTGGAAEAFGIRWVFAGAGVLVLISAATVSRTAFRSPTHETSPR